MSHAEPPFPKRARVGFRDFRIEKWDPLEAMGAGRYGQCCHVSRVIRVDVSHGSIQAASTLLHELMHATADVCAHDDVSEPSEEFLISSWSQSLTQVMRDSTEVREWLSWAWAQDELNG